MKDLNKNCPPTPAIFWMCGKCRTLSPVFLEVWQLKNLSSEISDVWQGKNLVAGDLRLEAERENSWRNKIPVEGREAARGIFEECVSH
jgi:hypothetical protein